MSTTLTQTKPAVDRAAAMSVPRHLALVLNAGARQRSPSLKEAGAALDSLLNACAERGIEVLTLLHPAGDSEIFEAALSSLSSSIENAQRAGLCLNFRANRNGRAELLEAVRRLAIQAQTGDIVPEKIQAQDIEDGLSTRDLPAVDLLISTGGGERLSGALLWQCAYAELLFIDVPWFEFSREQFDAALVDYAKRCRKFGGLA